MTTKTTMLAAAAAALLTAGARADLVPFTETFDTGNAGWADGSFAPLTWQPDGGPLGAGDGFVTATRSFLNTVEGDQITIFRGESGLGSSDGAFAGDWLTKDLNEFSFSIRHDAAAPLFVFARFAGPDNVPGAVGLSFIPVAPGAWTEITIAIDPGNPAIIEEGPPGTFEAVFSNVGNIQIGLEVPAFLAGVPVDVTFDLDNVAVVPAPGALAVLGLAGLTLGRRRRRDGAG